MNGTRKRFLDALTAALGSARAGQGELTLLLLDVDDFATVSAQVGTLRAGRLLTRLERRVAESARPDDVVCRTGGDGLAAILRGGDRLEAERLFARLQADLRGEPPADRVGVSAGIATARPGERSVELLARASTALRAAKNAGKGTAKAAL